MKNLRFKARFVMLAVLVVLAACKGSGGMVPAMHGPSQMSRMPPPMSLMKPRSTSPALIAAAPMARTAILRASAMTSVSPSRVSRMSDIQGLNWSVIPGSASQVAASPDGSLWALSSAPTGADKYIWHYVSGTWTNIPGLAAHLAVAPNDTLYAVNSGGGTYAYSGGTWSALGGGASAITVAADGSIYVLSNAGGGDQAIWHNVSGVWSQVPGAGAALGASWDTNNYTIPGGSVSANGVYVLNAAGSIYYLNPSSNTYASLPGAASAVAPTKVGGVFVLAYPASAGGNTIYYYNLNSPGWSAEAGAGVSVSTDGVHLYVIGASGAIYWSKINTTSYPTGPGQPLNGSTTYNNQFWGPPAVAAGFNFPVQWGWDGTGATIAIIMTGPFSQSDVDTYLSYFSIPQHTIFVQDIDGGPSGATNDLELTLDVETAAGLAPGASIVAYEIPSLTDGSLIDALNTIVSGNTADVVSYSAGGCESNNAAVDALISSAASKGVAVIASAGDNGSACFNGSPPSQVGVTYPASDPNAIGVGGLETSSSYPITSTTAWNDFNCSGANFPTGQCGTGGGVSGEFSIPSYQSGLAGEYSTSNRNVPDVALPAVSDALLIKGSWGGAVGTSWSAPQLAAMMAEIYEFCNVRFSSPVEVFYYADAVAGYSDFLDVNSGNNQWDGYSPYYSAGPGFDNVSGIGAPLGMNIAETVCPNRVPAAAVRNPRPQSYTPTLASRSEPSIVHTIRGLHDLGAAPGSLPVRVVIVLTPSEATAPNEAAVAEALSRSGFTILQRYANHLVIDAQAPASVVEAFFQTRIHQYDQGAYGTRYANAVPLILPSSIAPYVAGVVANNIVTMYGRPVPVRGGGRLSPTPRRSIIP